MNGGHMENPSHTIESSCPSLQMCVLGSKLEEYNEVFLFFLHFFEF